MRLRVCVCMCSCMSVCARACCVCARARVCDWMKYVVYVWFVSGLILVLESMLMYLEDNRLLGESVQDIGSSVCLPTESPVCTKVTNKMGPFPLPGASTQ